MRKTIAIFLCTIAIVVLVIYLSLWSSPEKAPTNIIVDAENINTLNFKNQDSVTIAVTTMYEGNALKNMIQGEHYRKEWEIPIKVPVVFLETLKGGLTIIKKGGGHQTQSLRLQNPEGIHYTLRSVAKNPEPLISDLVKQLGLENIVIDGISAQHPYGAIAAAAMADSLSIIHTQPSLVFVPKQDGLGEYNETYGNKLYYLEFETESPTNWTHLKNVVAIVDTKNLQLKKQEWGKKLKINKQQLVRNRLFDLVIGDWDRHAKQWGWVIQKQEEMYEATPIPSDRDNAFFSLEGLIPNVVASEHIEPRLQSFDKEIENFPALIYPFDRYFLDNTDLAVFTKQAIFIQTHLTDTAIETALLLWPREVYKLHGTEIKNKIIARREKLVAYAIAFKQELDNQGTLNQPLKGSEDLKLNAGLIYCFDCE